MRIKPVSDFIIAEPFQPPETKTNGGIVLPHLQNAGPRSVFAKVVAVGPGRYDLGVFHKTTVQPGDVITFNAQIGHEVYLGDKKYQQVREAGIIGIVEDHGWDI